MRFCYNSWSFKNDEQNREWLDDLIETFQRYRWWLKSGTPAGINRNSTSGCAGTPSDLSMWISPVLEIDQASARGTSHIGYIRVHGRNYKDWFRKDAGRDARYDYLYETKESLPWAKRAGALAEESEINEVDVVFNNHYKAQAVVNAIQFKHLLAGEVQPAPPLLFEHYPEALDGHAFPMDIEETAGVR
jgi:uncharacterized protein YecE (DUF72 family)